MIRHFRATALVAALILLLAAPASALATNPAPSVPFVGSAFGTDETVPPTDCPAGAAWRYVLSGTGQFAHLGRVALAVSHCTWFDPIALDGTFQGSMTFTAANGDTLVLTHSGTFALAMGPSGPVSSFIEFAWEVTGGTGRFATATGSGQGTALGDLAAGTTAPTYWGTIAYDASDRSAQ